jgi:hypothetical protein
MDAVVVFIDGSGGRRVPKSSLIGAREGWQRQTAWLIVFKACTVECILRDWRARQETSWKDGLQGRTPVHVGGRSALGVVHITSFVFPGHEAPFSLPQFVALAAGTIVHAHVVQLLPVGGVKGGWHC